MTSAPASFTKGKVAFTMGALMLLSATFPFATVFADTEQGPDGLVVVVEPRLGTLLGNGVAVASTGNMFLFDFQLFTDEGAPFVVTEIMVDVHTVDGRADSSAAWPTLIWSKNIEMAPTNKGTIRVPANEITFYTPKDPEYYHEMPFGGMTLTILAVKDAFGNSLLENSYYPAGQHSLAANRLAKEESWAEADAADELFTPLFLFNGQLSGLTQIGNPILNPGFEVGYQSGATPEEGEDIPVPAATTAIPPWFLVAEGAGSHIHSTVHIQGAAGSSGSAGTVRYNHDDNGNGLHFGQFFFVPGANSPGPWFGSSDVKAEFDIRVRDEAGLIDNFAGLATLHWAETTEPFVEAQATRGRAAGIPTDNVWRHVTLDFADVADGKQLTSFFLSLNLDDTTAPEGSQLVVEFDNVRLTGAVLTDGAVNPTNDLTDGYSAFVLPVGGTVSTTEQVTQKLTALAGGAKGYVYRLKAMDYTGIDPKFVDVSNGVTVLALVDESYVPDMSRAPEDVVYYAQSDAQNANTFFRFVDIDGEVSDDLLVVVPSSLSGSYLVPWMFNDIAVGDTYTSTYGGLSEPVAAYHSAARNNLMFTHLADSMDLEFTPIALDAGVGPSMAYSTTALLTCLGQGVDVMCSADPNPDLQVSVETASPVLETLTVQILANGPVNETLFPDKVLGSGTVGTPGGDATITLSTAAMDELTRVADSRVFARVLPGTFADGAQTGLFKLDNFLPVASITSGALDGLFKGSKAEFTSTSTDPDGTIVSQAWEVFLVEDATDDSDDVPVGLRQADTDPSVSYTAEDDGTYRVDLTVVDSGGATATDSMTFSVGNLGPSAVISGPAFGGVDVPLTFTYTVADADGVVVNHSISNGIDPLALCLLESCPIEVTFPEAGAYTITVDTIDDDGAASTTSFAVVIDGLAPTSEISGPVTPAEGWFTAPVELTITRADTGGAGVAFSKVTIDDVEEIVPGEATIVRTIDTDGTHVVSVVTTDRAGNTDLLSTVSRTVKLDLGKPTVSIVGPTLVDGAPIAGVFLADQAVDISVAATDALSGIRDVVFYVDGGDAAGTVETAGEDGLYHLTWTAAGSGFHEIVVTATDNAGQTQMSETITILVI